MEIINLGGKDGMCIKCHRDLSTSEKRSMMPICNKCISWLIDIIKDKIGGDGIKEFSDDVSNFTDFISSSSKLMGLGDIVVIQVCFNVYMDMVATMGKKNPIIARKIFKDAKRFIEIELERFEYNEEDCLDKDKEEDSFGIMMDMFNNLMRDHGVLDNTKGNNKKGNMDNKKDIEKEDREHRNNVNK